jgi:hypothetical protein
MIDLFAWVVLISMIASMLVIFVWLGLWPGRVAHQRQHPYQDAIRTGSWVFLLLGGVIWPFMLVWAYATPAPTLNEEDIS